jgi:hypothetical protein
VFVALDRSPDGAWYRIRLARGISGWVLSELVWPFMVVEETAHAQSDVFSSFRKKHPIAGGRVNLTVQGGVLDWDGLFAVRAGFLPTRHYLLELALHQSVGSLGNLTTLTAEVAVLVAPKRPVIPYAAAGGGTTQFVPHQDSRLFTRGIYPTLTAGGGLLIGLTDGLLIRLDARQTLVFSPDQAWSMLAVTGGLMATF